jgi:iron complex outermembrane receptor protein
MKLSRVFLTSCVTPLSIAALSSPAAAQSAQPAAPSVDEAQPGIPVTQVATPPIGGDAPTERQDDIVVTGSSIRGAPPVGSNLISVGQAQIQSTPAQSVQQILKSVPAVTGLGSAGQGAFQSNDASGTNAPTIHALGGSASTTTLILVDGHRIPLTGTTHALGDPNMVPTNALERVEVLADGASSVYGSDAVAGVINFITRRRYDGIEVTGQIGLADGYRTYNGSALAGKTWDTGSALFAYTYSRRSNLLSGDRSFTARDHSAQGGTNQATFNCAPASIQPTGSALVYAYPYSGAGVTNAAANAFCDFSGLSDLLPQEIRNNGMIKIIQEVGDKLTLEVDAVYSNRRNKALNARGAVNATVFGPGSGRGTQINPFYVNVPGSTATSQTVRFDADELLGPGAYTNAGAEDFYVHGSTVYKFDDNWQMSFDGLFGIDNSSTSTFGGLCTSCATLALNGTTNQAGNLSTPSVPSSGLIVTQALTAANALDPYNPNGSNRTAAAILAQLTDSGSSIDARQTIKQGKLQVTGSLFSLPGGDAKLAAGIEGIEYGQRSVHVVSLNIGPSSTGSSRREFDYGKRTVKSGFAEVLIPIIDDAMDIPAVRSFTVNVSGRIDNYSDVGTTKNPKIAGNWEVFEGLKLRGNFAKSFVAPQPTNRGINAAGLTGESGFATSNNANIVLPIAQFPSAAQLPGCGAPATTCTISTALIQGLNLTGGGGSTLVPQKGKTWSIGGDFTPSFARGLRIGVTYWNNEVKGGITATVPSLAVGAPELNSLFTIFPAGATAAQIAAATGGFPQTSTLPAPVYFVFDNRSKNVLNLYVSGLDIETSYARDTDYGRFAIGNSLTYLTKFDQQVGSTPKFSILNSSGFNSTFPSIRVQGRANIGWEYEGLSFDGYLNYIGSFRNFSANTVAPLTRDALGNPTGGGDKVKGTKTVDVHLAYTIPGVLEKAQIFIDATNLFDRDPSFFNSANGYDQFTGNPIGRVVTLGFRTSL